MLDARYIGNATSGASLSACSRYRYDLWRTWNAWLPVAVFVMLNPSTADATKDDHTIRKCVAFAKKWECGAIYVVNLFAYRTTYPKDLIALDPITIVGKANNSTLKSAFHNFCSPGVVPGPCIVGWGSQSNRKLSNLIAARAAKIRAMAAECNVQLQCLGTTKNGNPRHPLMLSYSTKLEAWNG